MTSDAISDESANLVADRAGVDPVTLEIIHGKLIAIADEMGLVLARSSLSPVIYEVLDFACGVCDANGQLVAQTNGITVFTGTFSTQIQAVLAKFGDDMHPGDIYLLNDPFEGGTHLCDICIIAPTYVGSTLAAFSIAIAHWSEIGGKTAGSLPPDATEIFQEGLRLPTLRLYHRGVKQQVVFDIIAANSRLPDLSLGDLNAQLAAVRIADLRLRETEARYGLAQLSASFEAILDSSERLSRVAISELPDGVFTATDWIDGDGIVDERFPVQVAVTIEGDNATVDFTGSSPQLNGPVNCTESAMISAVKSVFKAMVEPQAPSNDGWFRPLTVVCPPETAFSALPPAPVGWFFEGAGQVSELVWKALAPILHDRFCAGSSNSLCVTVLSGTSNGDPFVLVEPGMVGWGATSDRNGASVVSAITNGDTFNYSIELLEAKFPLRVVQYALNVEGGVGAGRHRGGFGAVREYEILSPRAELSASFGRSIERPWGLDHGSEGSCNAVEVTTGGRTIRGARLPTLSLFRGDRVKLITGGGGGFGDPRHRPIEDVAEDVCDGYLTPAGAEADYLVVVAPGGVLDRAATVALREQAGS